MAGATLLSVTLVPVLCRRLIGGRVRGEASNPIMRPLVWAYRPVLAFALRQRGLTLAVAALIMAGAFALVPRIGREFMPPLNEGALMFMPVPDPAISLTQAIEITKKQNQAIQAFPEVASVVAKIARAETSTDPAPVNMTETIVNLKPEAAWRPGMTREKLIGELDAATTLPGVSNIWTQPIINRINMLTTGIRSEVGVKVFGSDLDTAPIGTQIPLAQLADIRSVSGPSMISGENGLLVVTVLLNVRGRDVGSFVDEARRVIAEKVSLPAGSYVEWSGQYENEVRARQRLQIVIPIVFPVIYLLLYLTYRSFLDAAQVLLAVPFALAGGIYLLYGLGYNFSVAVWVGFIPLFGTPVPPAVAM